MSRLLFGLSMVRGRGRKLTGPWQFLKSLGQRSYGDEEREKLASLDDMALASQPARQIPFHKETPLLYPRCFLHKVGGQGGVSRPECEVVQTSVMSARIMWLLRSLARPLPVCNRYSVDLGGFQGMQGGKIIEGSGYRLGKTCFLSSFAPHGFQDGNFP